MSHLAAIGFGYVAELLAHQLASEGWQITGSRRTDAGAEAVRSKGYHGMTWNDATSEAEILGALGNATHLLISAPPLPEGDPIAMRLDGLMERLPKLGWVGYFSSISVYGDHAGGWVDEATPLKPDSERAQRRVDAEAAWQEIADAHDRRLDIFRLPGIYGPGRSAFDRLRAGTARRIIKPGQVFNRMHVDDIAGVVCAAIAAGPKGGLTLNLSDDLPAPPQDVIAHAAELMGIAPPPEVPFEEADLSPMGRKFYGASKRVRNRSLKEQLGYKLIYPTYREGLQAIWSDEQSQ